jgi:hypothetical protein
MKAGVGCSDPYNPRNLCETTVFVSPSSLGTWADAAVTLKYYYTGSKPPPVGITFGCYWEHYNFGRTLGIPNAKARSSVGANY